jgi:acyl carrier protein
MASGTTDAEFLKNLTNALPDDRQELLTNHVREQVAKILRLEASYPLGRKDRLMDLGLDSLMAVELRSRLNKGLKPKRALSATLVFDYPTIESIAKYLEIELFGSEASDAVTEPTSSVDADRTQGEQKIMALSEEEIEALLLKKFEDEQ